VGSLDKGHEQGLETDVGKSWDEEEEAEEESEEGLKVEIRKFDD